MSEGRNPEVPDYYFDRVRVTVTLFGINVTIALSENPDDDNAPPPVRDLAIIRTSPIHAKLLAMMLRKQIKRFEEDSGIVFPIPENVLVSLDLDTEDW